MTKTIWIDLDNTPHVLLFNPIIPELEKRGYNLVVTTRDAYQVSAVAKLYGIEHTPIGKHYGKNKLYKLMGTFYRALQLVWFFHSKTKPDIVVNHGSRSQILASKIMRIKSLTLYDYEHTADFFFTRATYKMAPAVVVEVIKSSKNRPSTFAYPGIKEDVYVPFFKPKNDIRKEIGVIDAATLVLVRPPATEAHYHNPESEIIFTKLIPYLVNKNATILLSPRNDRQAAQLHQEFVEYVNSKQLIIPNKVFDGLTMIWYADLVVSGGGTMNREAAALNVPVYSIFRGKKGAVDRHLEKEKKLVFIEDVNDIESKIVVKKRDHQASISENLTTFNFIVSKIIELTNK